MQEYQSHNDDTGYATRGDSGTASRGRRRPWEFGELRQATAKAENLRIEQIVANHRSANDPCLVWVPAFDAETGLGYHRLDMGKTLGHNHGWSLGEIKRYVAKRKIPDRRIEAGFDYEAITSACP